MNTRPSAFCLIPDVCRRSLRRRALRSCFGAMLVLCSAFLTTEWLQAQERTNSVADSANTTTPGTNDPIARIRDEGLNHSEVIKTLSYLTEVIGARLTGSPNLKRANDWTRDTLAGWGLTNAHLEAWGPFGRGWSLKRFSAQLVEPQAIPLIGFPNAWSPGFAQPLVADVRSFEARNDDDLDKYRGKLYRRA